MKSLNLLFAILACFTATLSASAESYELLDLESAADTGPSTPQPDPQPDPNADPCTAAHAPSLDVDGDGHITPSDAVEIIKWINQNGIGPVPEDRPSLDVNGDEEVTPLDILIIINYLNDHGGCLSPPKTPTTADIDEILL